MRPLLLVCLVALAPTCAGAAGVRLQFTTSPTGSHIIATCPAEATLRIEHQGDRLTIGTEPPLGRAIVFGHAPLIRAATPDVGRVLIELSAGVELRQVTQGHRTTIDLFAPSQPERPGADVGKRAAGPDAGLSGLIPGLPAAFAVSVDGPKRAPPPAKAKVPPSHPKPDLPAAQAAKTVSIAPAPVVVDAIAATASCSAPRPQGVLLPFSSEVGVAALRRRDGATLFFDEERPIDLSPVRADPAYGHIEVRVRNDATQLHVPLGPDQQIAVSRQSGGWCLSIGQSTPSRVPVIIENSGSGLRFLLDAPGKVITVTDPASGSTLLIGTDRAAANAVFIARRSELFALERSEIGIVVEALSDRLTLRPVRGGFALSTDDAGGLAIPRDLGGGQSGETGLTHLLDVEPTTTSELGRKLIEQLATAARTPERARLAPRLAAAQSMLELGMGREARTLLLVAFADDPAASGNPHGHFLKSLADLVTGTPGALFGDMPPLNDEARLWRALSGTDAVSLRQSDAMVVANSLSLLLSYPEHLRDIAAGLAARLLLADGRPLALAALGRLPVSSGTAVAKANGLQAGGDTTGALRQLDLLARSNDLGVSAEAILSATLLRADIGQLSPKAAAEILGRHRLDWRATGREGPMMLQQAALERRSGQCLAAIELWREVERRFPDLAETARTAITDTLASLATPKIAFALPAADFISIVTGSTDELAAHPDLASKLGPVLADRLEALDLPERATEVLRKLIDATPPGVPRAMLGAKLASMLLDEDQPAEVQAVLDNSAQADLPPALDAQRRRTLARALDRQGKSGAALLALGDPAGAANQDLRASLLTAAGRWHEAKLALVALTNALPAEGMLRPDQASLVIRLATAASRDDDKILLSRLARQAQGRWPDDEDRRTFELMTTAILSDTKVPPAAHSDRESIPPAKSG